MKNDTLKKLKSMRLPAFAEAYEKQIDQEAEYGSMSFHERLMLLVDAEYDSQHNNKIKKLISQHAEKKTERYPAQMTVEELKEVLKKSIEESKQGLGMTTEELRKRHPLCK